ncbi:coat protein [Burdock mottle virus]|nr:coat protein [Burdock mottle virus]BAN62705.1 coat protein [Burdock mottle virus]
MYLNWNDITHHTHMSGRWVRLSEAVAFVKFAQAQDLSKARSLEFVKSSFIDMFSKWTTDNPFVHPKKRFPAEVSKWDTITLWVNFDEPPLSLVAASIITGSDGGSAANASAGTRRDVVSDGKFPAEKKVGTDDSAYNLHRSVAALQVMLSSRELYYDAFRFEQKYGLKWGDPPLPATGENK